jgi:cytosine/adenosine deaminase-related metal-dependent hydrolase
MPQYRAAWVLPIAEPPIRDGWVRVERNRITALGHHRRGEATPPDEIDLGSVALLPGLVNAHTHLELSWMRGKLEPTDDFPVWIRNVIALQRHGNPAGGADTHAAIGKAIEEARRSGTVLFGDVSNTLASSDALVQSGAAAVVFHEVIGFQSDRALKLADEALRRIERQPAGELVRYSLAAHAPYSVSPALFQAIRRVLGREAFSRCSVHLAESEAETEFLLEGTGPWRQLLEELGTWDSSWLAPECGAVEYLDRMGFIGDRLLVVHGVQLSRTELERLKAKGATLVTCPRGNALTGAGKPPVATFYASGVQVAVGTDSLASVPDLNLFRELAELRRLAPKVPARKLLESGTIAGARALGFDSDFGTIEPGKRDSLIAVETGSMGDVEEHLVNGVAPGQIHMVGGVRLPPPHKASADRRSLGDGG